MLVQCELRHTVGVELHAGGMLHSIVCCGRRCSAAAEVLAVVSTEEFRQIRFVKGRRIRLVLLSNRVLRSRVWHAAPVALRVAQFYPFLKVGKC